MSAITEMPIEDDILTTPGHPKAVPGRPSTTTTTRKTTESTNPKTTTTFSTKSTTSPEMSPSPTKSSLVTVATQTRIPMKEPGESTTKPTDNSLHNATNSIEADDSSSGKLP